MTFTSLLEIKRKLIRYEDEKGLHLAERVWIESGEPCEPQALCQTIDGILDLCMERGIRFPKILLARKKQLQCGTWKPHVSTDKIQRNPTSGQIGSDCADCAGTGYVVRPGGGSASLCTRCEAWKRNSFSGRGRLQ
jgi:hypothetical protein